MGRWEGGDFLEDFGVVGPVEDVIEDEGLANGDLFEEFLHAGVIGCLIEL